MVVGTLALTHGEQGEYIRLPFFGPWYRSLPYVKELEVVMSVGSKDLR